MHACMRVSMYLCIVCMYAASHIDHYYMTKCQNTVAIDVSMAIFGTNACFFYASSLYERESVQIVQHYHGRMN